MAHKPPTDDKAARLAEALRANLRRRKTASRKVKPDAPTDGAMKPARDK